MSAPPLSRSKALLFWLLTAAFVGAVAFAGLEIMLRVLLARTFVAETSAPLVASANPALGYEIARSHHGPVRTDADGIRLPKKEVPAGGSRILLVGDSVSFGSGVDFEATFGRLTEAKLSASLRRPVAVWNAAVPGYNTSQEAITARQLAAKVKPDLIVLELCMNDYLEPPKLSPGGTLDATAPEANRGDGGFSLLAFLYQSRAVVFLKEKFKDLQKSKPEWFPGPLHYVHHLPKKAGWEAVRQGLLDLRRVSEETGAPVLVVIFPIEEQLRLRDRGVQDALIEFLQRERIAYLDLYPVFEPLWRERLYVDYWAQATLVDKLHLSEQGHRRAAEAIAAAIVDRKLLPQPQGS